MNKKIKKEIKRIKEIIGLPKKLNYSILTEEKINGKTIVNVDIQPEYQKYITFNLSEWIRFLNNNAGLNKYVFLYNGYDTLGMITESDYQYWLLELGLDEDVINNSIFYDKGYAFFRYCMDEGINENEIVSLIKYMNENNINDSRDINEEMWNNFKEESGYNDIRDLLEFAGDCISIPDLMDFISRYSNIVLTGGGINECLKEVELSLMALNKNYEIIKKYTY